jgi:hypothetical protein
MNIRFESNLGGEVLLSVNVVDEHVSIRTHVVLKNIREADLSHIGIHPPEARKMAAELIRCADFIENRPPAPLAPFARPGALLV